MWLSQVYSSQQGHSTRQEGHSIAVQESFPWHGTISLCWSSPRLIWSRVKVLPSSPQLTQTAVNDDPRRSHRTALIALLDNICMV
jgi:hypothetical protein